MKATHIPDLKSRSQIEIMGAKMETINDYKIIEKIGHDKHIFKVKKDNQYFTIYLLPEIDDDRLKPVQEDIEKAKQLNHLNIKKIYEIGKVDNQLYYVKDYFSDYQEVSDKVRRYGPLKEDEIIAIIRQVAMALEYAYQSSIIHGWITPNEIAIVSEKVYICLSCPVTTTTMVVGNPSYASPEYVQGKNCGIQSDIFSLGSTSYFMATGERPFAGSSSVALITAILKKEPKAIKKLNPKISSKTCKIIKKMMAKNLAKRYQNYTELLNDLENLI